MMTVKMKRVRLMLLVYVAAIAMSAFTGCGDAGNAGDFDSEDPVEDVTSSSAAITKSQLSTLVLGDDFNVSFGYQPNGVHAGIDFSGTGDNITPVKSPVNGIITANTGACGKVAIYDGANTIIMAHMADRTDRPVGSAVSVGTYLGKASRVIGGGCTATGPHLHMEIRTGDHPVMANPANNNTGTTLNPLTYTYGGFPSVSLMSPANGAYDPGNPVMFTWSPIQGATSYRLQISTSNDFDENGCINGCVYDQAHGSTSRSVSLASGTMCYWRVRGGNPATNQGGDWSEVRSMTR